jgi:hypothetical protein
MNKPRTLREILEDREKIWLFGLHPHMNEDILREVHAWEHETCPHEGCGEGTHCHKIDCGECRREFFGEDRIALQERPGVSRTTRTEEGKVTELNKNDIAELLYEYIGLIRDRSDNDYVPEIADRVVQLALKAQEQAAKGATALQEMMDWQDISEYEIAINIICPKAFAAGAASVDLEAARKEGRKEAVEYVKTVSVYADNPDYLLIHRHEFRAKLKEWGLADEG